MNSSPITRPLREARGHASLSNGLTMHCMVAGEGEAVSVPI